MKKKIAKFPGQRKGERVYLILHRHILSFIGPGLIGLVMIILPPLAFLVINFFNYLVLEIHPSDYKIIILIGSGYLLFCVGFLLIAWMDYYLDLYIVTDRRIIDVSQKGLFSRSLSAVDLVDVEDVRALETGFLSTFFDYGDLYVQTAGKTRNVDFHQVPNPYSLARKIMNFHEKALKSEGQNSSQSQRSTTKSPEEKPFLVEKEAGSKIEPKVDLKTEKKKEDQIGRDRLKKGGRIEL